jgi:replicative DNA helicase
LRGDGVGVNALTIISQLQIRDKLEDAGGAELIQRLATDEPKGKPEEAASYCRSLKTFSHRRRMKWVASKLTSLADEPLDSKEISEKVRSLMKAAEDDSTPEDVLLNPGKIVEQVGLSKMLNPMLGQKIIDTPWEKLNDLIIGYSSGTLNIFGARPSVGKSAMVAKLLFHNAKKGVPCAFFSLEMKREAILRRLVCAASKVSLRKCYKNELTPDERSRFATALAEIKDIPLLISDLYGRTTLQAEHAIRRAQAELGPLGLVAFDHLQLMKPMRKHATRHHEIGEITSTLKQLAMELDTRIALLCQLSRAGKDRAENRPVITDLKESGDIEQDADTVALLHRPEMYKADGDKGKSILYMAKVRDGELGEVPLWFEGRYTDFLDADA